MKLLTLGIASIGGGLLNILQLPLAWLLGAMFSVAFASFFSKTLETPHSLRLGATALLGTVVGAMATIDIVYMLVEFTPSIIFMLVFQITLVILGIIYVRHKTNTDRFSALLSAYPGAISQITALSLERPCHSRFIIVNHTTRLFLVISVIPLIITSISHTSLLTAETAIGQSNTNNLKSIIWPLSIALIGYLLGKRLRLTTPALFGPMLLASALNMLGYLPNFSIHQWLIPLAQIIIGASIGLHFQEMQKKAWKNVLSIHLPYAIGLLAATILASIGAHHFLDIPLSTCLLILAPGGLSEIALIAYTLNIDPLMVTTHHVIRSLFGFILIPVLMRIWIRD